MVKEEGGDEKEENPYLLQSPKSAPVNGCVKRRKSDEERNQMKKRDSIEKFAYCLCHFAAKEKEKQVEKNKKEDF